MATTQVFLFYLATVICATASGAYIISAPHYEDFNKMIVNCSSNGAEQMPDPLWCSFDGHDPIALPLSKTRRSGCVAATALPNSRISVVLQGCNRVELRCGNVKSNNNSALSCSVVLWSLERGLKVVAQPSERQNEVIVFCQTFGIKLPHIMWDINGQFTQDHVVGDEWSFTPHTSSDVAVTRLKMWHTAETGTLQFNESSANVSVGCGHKPTNKKMIWTEEHTVTSEVDDPSAAEVDEASAAEVDEASAAASSLCTSIPTWLTTALLIMSLIASMYDGY